jgi:putative endonuclease
MLLCENGNYYTGCTKNVELRFRQHKHGNGARYTRMNKPRKIVYVEEFNSRGEAMRREKMIKQLSHKRKQRLAANTNVDD